jgi:muconolactone D-isomerase
VLFHVRMDVTIPHDLDPDTRTALLATEQARALDLQRSGTWAHLWRVVGHYSNISIFAVDSTDELHDILWTLPLFPYMNVQVTPLAQHPSSLGAQP